VVVLDFGAKQNILRCLAERGCEVTVVPAKTPADEILAQKPDGVLLSNGPGDPACVTYGIKTIKELADKKMPMFGICLGHQMLGLALGGETYKLKFGHHGANHPIKDLETGQVDITTQNHGFAVKAEQKGGEWTLKGNKDVLVTHINLNDQSAAGLRHKTKPVFSVQYHPEAAAGPHDAQHLFDRFMKLMDKKEN
jgi:carbamoyl-phosphate synthase small subunit